LTLSIFFYCAPLVVLTNIESTYPTSNHAILEH